MQPFRLRTRGPQSRRQAGVGRWAQSRQIHVVLRPRIVLPVQSHRCHGRQSASLRSGHRLSTASQVVHRAGDDERSRKPAPGGKKSSRLEVLPLLGLPVRQGLPSPPRVVTIEPRRPVQHRLARRTLASAAPSLLGRAVRAERTGGTLPSDAPRPTNSHGRQQPFDRHLPGPGSAACPLAFARSFFDSHNRPVNTMISNALDADF